MASYSVAEAKDRLPSLINAARSGEEVVITRRGEPVAVLHPIQQAVKRDMAAALERLRIGRSKLPYSEKTGALWVDEMRDEDSF